MAVNVEPASARSIAPEPNSAEARECAANACLDTLEGLDVVSTQVRAAASRQWWVKFLWARDPEKNKALARVAFQLEQLRGLILLRHDREATHLDCNECAFVDQTVRQCRLPVAHAFGRTCKLPIKHISRDAAYELVEVLQQAYLMLAPSELLLARLDAEAKRPARFDDGWPEYFDADELDRLRRCMSGAAPEGGATHVGGRSAAQRTARARLLYLHDQRSKSGRHQRARSALRVAFMLLLWPLVVLLAGVAVWVTLDTGGDRDLMASAMAAAAVASSISGVYTLRDSLPRMREMRAFLPSLVLQPTVGAVAGLFVYWILQSKLFAIGTVSADSIAYYATFGFLAGFSEPFFLGIVGRVSGAAQTHDSSVAPMTANSPVV